MPVFAYKGFDAGGKAVSGLVDAENPKIARSRLRKQGVFPTEVQQKHQEATRGAGLNVQIDLTRFFEFVSQRDIAQMTQQFSVLTAAAIPVVEALAALVDQAENAKLKVVLSQVKEKVNSGTTLADALAEHPSIFPNLYIHMVRAGEKSGALDTVLERLADYTDKQVKLQGKVGSALVYPALMSVVGVLIMTGLFVGVIPRIRGLFDSLGGQDQLPLLTRFVFGIGDLVMGWWWLLGLLAIGFVAGFRRWSRTAAGSRRLDQWRLRAPIFGRLARLVAVSRFCRTLGTLLESGVPILTALEISKAVVGNAVLAEAVSKAAANIQEGQSISIPLKQSGEFPPMVTHMIAIGEKTGELERMLDTVADSYDSQVENQIDAMTSLLGPAVILMMGGIVFLTALALLLPMMNMTSLINR